MSRIIEKEIEKQYNTFVGLPSNKAVVRQNIKNDAFEIVIYDLLFRENKYTSLKIENLEELTSCIVPPPDDSVDIFYEEINGDEFLYHVVQVKNSNLKESEIKACFALMDKTITSFCKNPLKVNENLRTVIANTSFDEVTKDNIKYYVVHTGDINSIKSLNSNESVINKNEIETLLNSINEFSVPFHTFKMSGEKTILEYKNSKEDRKSIICTIKANELAELVKKYYKTDIGRNILFGQNLRDALNKGSKTYDGIKETIIGEPENFWYYNNGITIITKKLNFNENEIKLENFSIINGAQTSNSFAKYQEDINRDYSGKEKIDLLKNLSKVSVLARIVETAEDNNFKENITLFNNTQNPISTRDMVSNSDEQKKLRVKFLDGNPKIFIEIRRGEIKPKGVRFYKHRVITNTELAQFLYSSIQKPFNAKDKKNKIFNKDTSTDYKINRFYDEIFNLENGIAHKTSSAELDELLFIKELHKKAKKILSDRYNTRIQTLKDNLENDQIDNKDKNEKELRDFIKLKQINNINTFYNVTLFYYFKTSFDKEMKYVKKRFKIDDFYNKKENYQENLIKKFAYLFNALTIKIIKELAFDDPPKFIRAKPSEEIFLDKLKDELQEDFELRDKYEEFIQEFKK